MLSTATGRGVVALAFAATAGPALADTVQDCGRRSFVGDYIRTGDGARIWCSQGGFGDVIAYTLAFFHTLYLYLSVLNGWVVLFGGLAVFVFGHRLTGSRASVTGWVERGRITSVTFNPAVVGTATSFPGRLAGVLFQVFGMIVLVMGVVLLVSG